MQPGRTHRHPRYEEGNLSCMTSQLLIGAKRWEPSGSSLGVFISLVRKYTRAKKLTPRMLNELVEKIEVFNAEKVNGVWEQRLRIRTRILRPESFPPAFRR